MASLTCSIVYFGRINVDAKAGLEIHSDGRNTLASFFVVAVSSLQTKNIKTSRLTMTNNVDRYVRSDLLLLMRAVLPAEVVVPPILVCCVLNESE